MASVGMSNQISFATFSAGPKEPFTCPFVDSNEKGFWHFLPLPIDSADTTCACPPDQFGSGTVQSSIAAVQPSSQATHRIDLSRMKLTGLRGGAAGSAATRRKKQDTQLLQGLQALLTKTAPRQKPVPKHPQSLFQKVQSVVDQAAQKTRV